MITLDNLEYLPAVVGYGFLLILVIGFIGRCFRLDTFKVIGALFLVVFWFVWGTLAGNYLRLLEWTLANPVKHPVPVAALMLGCLVVLVWAAHWLYVEGKTDLRKAKPLPTNEETEQLEAVRLAPNTVIQQAQAKEHARTSKAKENTKEPEPVQAIKPRVRVPMNRQGVDSELAKASARFFSSTPKRKKQNVKHLPTTVYYLRITCRNKVLYKVGITCKTIQQRFGEDMRKITVISKQVLPNRAAALRLEGQILRANKAYQYKGTNVLRSGNTELFTRDVLQLDAA